MALIKEIELENGVIINYHKITSFNKITNISNNIEVSSYTNKSQRKKEKRYQDLQKKKNNNEELTLEEEIELNKGINVFIYTTFYQLEYDQNQTIEDVYEYLKKTEMFMNAKDD